MFEADLCAKLSRIFGVKIENVTLDAFNLDAPDQGKLFVEILEAKPRMMSTARETARVTGALVMFSRGERLPYGFFHKRIEKGLKADVKPFFFGSERDMPDSPARMQNIHERRCDFTFLYDSQYDPARGSLTSLETEIEME